MAVRYNSQNVVIFLHNKMRTKVRKHLHIILVPHPKISDKNYSIFVIESNVQKGLFFHKN